MRSCLSVYVRMFLEAKRRHQIPLELDAGKPKPSPMQEQDGLLTTELNPQSPFGTFNHLHVPPFPEAGGGSLGFRYFIVAC